MARITQKDPVDIVRDFINEIPEEFNEPIFVGIDPGAEGAIAFLAGDQHCVIDIPTYQVLRNKKNQTEFDRVKIREIFRRFDLTWDIIVGTEHPVPSMGGSTRGAVVRGKASPFASVKLGIAHAIWPLFLEEKGYIVHEFYPEQWKRKMGLNSQKEYSRQMAISMYPDAELHLKKHHNRAEALLLARYVRYLQSISQKPLI